MLSELYLENFKSFKRGSISLNKLTIFSGLNNSGKSTAFQALRMLRKFVDTGDPTLSGHGALEEIHSRLSSKTAPVVLKVRDSEFGEATACIDCSNSTAKVTIEGNLAAVTPLVCFIGADRWGPKVNLPLDTSISEIYHVGELGEFVLDFLSRHERDIVPSPLIHPGSEGETLEFNVRAWLAEIAPDVDFKHFVERKTDSSYATIDGYRPTNVGYGLSYALPIIVSLLGMAIGNGYVNGSETKKIIVLLENPESHLHPRGQTSIGKLIALAASCGVQVMVETHSDHLIDGMRIAVKEKILSPNEVAINYFKLSKSGETNQETPKIYENGKLEFWPEGFFDQTLKNRAVLARRA